MLGVLCPQVLNLVAVSFVVETVTIETGILKKPVRKTIVLKFVSEVIIVVKAVTVATIALEAFPHRCFFSKRRKTFCFVSPRKVH